MLTQPSINTQEIISSVQQAYHLTVNSLQFLPLGADFHTAVYKIETTDRTHYFLKLRSDNFIEASATIPKHLNKLGVQQILSPIETNSGNLWISLHNYKALLYPYIDGANGVERKLSKQQWIELGSTIKKLHTIDIPNELKKSLPQEEYSLNSCQIVEKFLQQIDNEHFDDQISHEMAQFLQTKKTTILLLIEQTRTLQNSLLKSPPPLTICHADLHGWNMLIDQENNLHVIDWDTLILAPKERDLMFIGASISDSGRSPDEEERLFYQGYKSTDINKDLLYYYRSARIIQDIAEYCEQIFLSSNGGDDRAQSYKYLQSNFLPGGTVNRALTKIN